jgi:hypothetical protein
MVVEVDGKTVVNNRPKSTGLKSKSDFTWSWESGNVTVGDRDPCHFLVNEMKLIISDTYTSG